MIAGKNFFFGQASLSNGSRHHRIYEIDLQRGDMKIRWLLQLVLICVLCASVKAQNIEGLNWWWDLKSADFIVEGLITYEADKYYELTAKNVAGKDQKYFWLVGNLKVNKLLYINKNSEHIEEYQLFLKDTEKTYPVLIPAYESTIFSSAAKPRAGLRPIPGIDITKEATILNLTQVTIYPIIDVTIRSLVPVGNINQARELIAKRENNLLAK